MDFFNQVGKFAIGSRMRIFSERLMEGASSIYQIYDVPLEPKWFPVFYVLSHTDRIAITDIANKIGHSHPSVSKTVREMAKKGFVKECKDEKDKRKNLVSLSEKGKAVLPKIKHQYQDLTKVVEELLDQTTHNLWKAMDEMEYLLEQKSLLRRIIEVQKDREATDVHIVPFQTAYRAVFKDLNEEWIVQYFKMEKTDRAMLENPEEYILSKGGEILFALYQGEAVGTCALIPMHGDTEIYELAKMAVSPNVQGKGIGYILGQATIDKARELKAKKVYLESNTVLSPAINLYRKLGFKKVTGYDTPYERCNIQMELVF